MAMKNYIVAVVLGLAAFQVARAGEKEHRKLAEEYLKLSDVEKQMALALDTQVDLLVKAYPDHYKEHRAALKRTYQRFYSWEKVKPLMTDVCIKHFSEDELKEIIQFVKSPIGQKFLKKQPELAKSNQEITLKLVGGNGEAIQKAFEEEVEKDR